MPTSKQIKEIFDEAVERFPETLNQLNQTTMSLKITPTDVVHELDNIAREYDSYDYGLPTTNPSTLKQMETVVETFAIGVQLMQRYRVLSELWDEKSNAKIHKRISKELDIVIAEIEALKPLN